MPRKMYVALLIGLTVLFIVTSPPLVRSFLQEKSTVTPTPITPTATFTPTLTPDPFAAVPTATPHTGGVIIEIQALPSPILGELPPTFTPILPTTAVSITPVTPLPNPVLTETTVFPAPTPAAIPPNRLRIPRLALDVPVTPVGMAPAPGPGALSSPVPPSGKTAGWANTSAPFAQPGNTVLVGRHQIKGLTVFYGLWTLEPGDEVILYAGEQVRRYVVAQMLNLPKQEANATYLQPTADERLTLVTGGPEQENTPRTVVVALPE